MKAYWIILAVVAFLYFLLCVLDVIDKCANAKFVKKMDAKIEEGLAKISQVEKMVDANERMSTELDAASAQKILVECEIQRNNLKSLRNRLYALQESVHRKEIKIEDTGM